ncbi:hypothetical protein MVES_000877 [Malassezia vespertilionis]|uniref:CREG-like beta-barrel domain-containing protein n=1 Tax=Malassezia vespertilionis TaxID=2020962 RepID=A0A2N1JE71_9BASI|nr:hypothetical protein MVES_000877 [Malassezia vespertilionis]
MAQVGAEYYAPCFTPDMLDQVSNARPGDLLFLALPVSENWRSLVDTNKTASVFVGPNPDPHVVDVRHSDRSISGRVHWAKDRPVFRKGMASKARSALYGKMVSLPTTAPYLDALHACFVQHHPDAEAWVPGSRKSPHVAQWVRFTPHRIYYVGGFGDEHYIGDLDMDIAA